MTTQLPEKVRKIAAQAHNDTPPEALPDPENPAFVDARKTYWLTMVSSVLFVGAILVFIL